MCFLVQENAVYAQAAAAQAQAAHFDEIPRPGLTFFQSFKLLITNGKIMSALSLQTWYGLVQGGLNNTALTL